MKRGRMIVRHSKRGKKVGSIKPQEETPKKAKKGIKGKAFMWAKDLEFKMTEAPRLF